MLGYLFSIDCNFETDLANHMCYDDILAIKIS